MLGESPNKEKTYLVNTELEKEDPITNSLLLTADAESGKRTKDRTPRLNPLESPSKFSSEETYLNPSEGVQNEILEGNETNLTC